MKWGLWSTNEDQKGRYASGDKYSVKTFNFNILAHFGKFVHFLSLTNILHSFKMFWPQSQQRIWIPIVGYTKWEKMISLKNLCLRKIFYVQNLSFCVFRVFFYFIFFIRRFSMFSFFRNVHQVIFEILIWHFILLSLRKPMIGKTLPQKQEDESNLGTANHNIKPFCWTD